MNTSNNQKKLATDLGTVRALSDKTNDTQPGAVRYPFGHLSDQDQREALMNELFESLNVTLNAIGLNICQASLGFAIERTPQECYEGLVKAQLVPAVKVGSVQSTEEFPSWLEGNLC